MLYNALPKGAFRASTTDRDKEFVCCNSAQKRLGLTFHFADVYSSWQRGGNKNFNGLLHKYYSKKTNLTLVQQADLTHHLFLINHRPRKCLDWKSSI